MADHNTVVTKQDHKTSGGTTKQVKMEEESSKQVQDIQKIQKQTPPSSFFRADAILWTIGMLFILATLGAMFGFGHMRNWDADSGYTHNETTSQFRFLPEPYKPEPGVPERSDPQSSSRWYYWQLDPAKATAWTRLFVWLCYIGHQLTIWGTIYYAQRVRSKGDYKGSKYTQKITTFNIVPFVLNIFFHILHVAQTHITYDGLAQDVSESSNQASAIMMLELILLMEYRDRGLFFGWPTAKHKDKVSRKLRFTQGPVNLVRKHHGYAFSWVVIFTLWYHPMENTWGHAFGFMHTWMVMLQGCLMYTDLHLNRWWRLVLEAWVILHGVIVAKQTESPFDEGSSLWPMFLFGFLWMLVVTQLFGLQFWKRIPWWTKGIPFLVYLGVCVWCYSWIPDRNGYYYTRLTEIIRIPAIEYIAVFFAWFIIELFIRIRKKFTCTDASQKPAPLSPFWETFYIGSFMLIYSIMVVVSFLIQELDMSIDFIALMVLFIFIFLAGAGLACMIVDEIMKGVRRKARMAKSKMIEESQYVGMASISKDVSADEAQNEKFEGMGNDGETNDAFQGDDNEAN